MKIRHLILAFVAIIVPPGFDWQAGEKPDILAGCVANSVIEREYVMGKPCTQCGENKHLDEFYRMKSATDGRKSECKACSNARAKRYRDENPGKAKTKPEYSRAYYLANADRIKAYQKQYAAENGDKISARRVAYRTANADQIKAREKAYRESNREKLRQAYYDNHESNLAKAKRYREKNPEKVRQSYAKWLAKNSTQKVRKRIAAGLRKSLAFSKPTGVFSLLPYSYDELVEHLGRTMPDGYTWDDIGDLHIDHIRPVSSFNFCSIDDPQFQECWSLDNLQLLPAEENISKSDSMETHNARVWAAICQVESGGDPDAHNPSEDARGIAQIRAIMVEDINRIVGENRYAHNDAYNPAKAREMFDIYNRHYHPKGDYERIARCWNGGPQGHKKQATLAYWRKVERVMKDD